MYLLPFYVAKIVNYY